MLGGHQHSSLANVDVFSVYFLGGEKRRSEIRLRSLLLFYGVANINRAMEGRA